MFSKVFAAGLALLLCFGVHPWQRTSEKKEQRSATRTAQTVVTAETPTQPLTEDLAIAAALDHAKLQKDDVRGLRAKRDRDDGVSVYEIEFRHGRVEYEYEIHAENGKILEWDKDVDD